MTESQTIWIKPRLDENNVASIKLFRTISKKSENDRINKIREKIIQKLFSNKINNKWTDHPVYGKQWKHIQEQITNVILELGKNECYTSYKAISKGGRTNNYDFEITYLNEGNIIKQIHLEFKYNMDSLCALPQFLEVYDKEMILFPKQYAEYYYENQLTEFVKLCDGNIDIPEKTNYLDNVSDITYSHPFFRFLYDNKNNMYKDKKQIVDKSRIEYLKEYATGDKLVEFNGNKLIEKIKKSQNKTYLLWKNNEFKIIEINTNNIQGCRIIPGSTKKFDFNLEILGDFPYNIKVVLNWGNNIGIANPRWKFKFIAK